MILPIVVIYCIIAAFFLADSSEQSYNKKKVFLIILGIALVCISTFRPEDMPDFDNYSLFFYSSDAGGRFEPGFVIITNILKELNNSIYLYLAFWAALAISLKLIAITKITNLIWASLLIYVSNIYILHDMIQMRCAVASGLLLFSVYYKLNNDLKKSLLVAVIALFFHYSSIIVFPVLFLNVKTINKVFYIGIIVCSYVLALTGNLLGQYLEFIPIKQYQDLLTLYTNVEVRTLNIFNLLQVFRVLLCCFFIIKVDKISKHSRYAVLLTKIYAISVSCFPLFSDLWVVALRVSELYQVIEIILIPHLMYSFEGNGIIKRILIIVIGAMFLFVNINIAKILI